MAKNEREWLKKVRMIGASEAKSGARLTANPFKAGRIRDPLSGRAHPRACRLQCEPYPAAVK